MFCAPNMNAESGQPMDASTRRIRIKHVWVVDATR